jgi:hypothetical protein
MGNGNSHRRKHYSKKGGAVAANMNEANAEPTIAVAPVKGEAPMEAEPGVVNAVDKKCCPCPDENKEEGFFAKLSPTNLEKKLVETQTNAIEGSKNAFSSGVENAKAGLSNKITDFLKPAQEGGRRRTRKHLRSKHKRSKHKSRKHKRSKHKQSHSKRSHNKRKSSRR